jgi:uncharacterized lipoprotein NlpE involved in copper resistance
MRLLLLLLVLAGCANRSDTKAIVAAPDTSAPKDPADAVRRYYAFLEAKDYPRAYAMWGQDGLSSKQTYAQFAAGFARTAHTRVTVTGPVSIEGAAGSSYAEVRVRVDAATTEGQEQHFGGAYVVRRANDVPGATDAQLRWHFDAARLDTLP